MSLGPVVSSSRLSEDKVVRSEDLSKRSGPHRVHCSGLQIDQDSSGHVFATGSFVVIHIDPLELQIGVSVVGTGGVDTVLVGDYLKRTSVIPDSVKSPKLTAIILTR